MDFVSVMDTRFRRIARVSPIMWFLLWTAVGGLFSLQLRWYYGLPWSLSVFWGFADWYLWSFLALGVFAVIRKLIKIAWPIKLRALAYCFAAPMVAALHVVLTMIVAGSNEVPQGHTLSEYFAALYAKKLTLNVLTFAAIAGIGDWLATRAQQAPPAVAAVGFMAKHGTRRRLVKPEEVIWGEVCGNEVLLHCRDGCWSVPLTMTQLLEKLPEKGFLAHKPLCLLASCLRAVDAIIGGKTRRRSFRRRTIDRIATATCSRSQRATQTHAVIASAIRHFFTTGRHIRFVNRLKINGFLDATAFERKK